MTLHLVKLAARKYKMTTISWCWKNSISEVFGNGICHCFSTVLARR